MNEDNRNSYPLRLPEDITNRVKASARRKNWTLSAWYREAIILFLNIEESRGGKL